MKNKHRFFIISMFFFMMLCPSVADAATTEGFEVSSADNVFALPASLKQIDEGAFEGTKPAYVFLPESVEQIGNNSFACISNKSKIVVPEYTYLYLEDHLTDDCDYQIINYSDHISKVGVDKKGMHFDSFLSYRSLRSKDDDNSGEKNYMEMISRARHADVQKYKVCRLVMRTIPYEIRNSEIYVQALDFL